MQELVGIVRQEDEMMQALNGIDQLKPHSKRAFVPGNIEYNPGWHTALDLQNLLTVSETLLGPRWKGRRAAAHISVMIFPTKEKQYESFNVVVRKGAGGEMQITHEPIPPMREDLKQIIQEMK